MVLFLSPDTPASPSRRGPKPRGRKVKPLTIAITLEQRAALEVLADTRQTSISDVVRTFIADGLAAISSAHI